MPSWDRADIKLSHVSKTLLLPLFLYRYVVSLTEEHAQATCVDIPNNLC